MEAELPVGGWRWRLQCGDGHFDRSRSRLAINLPAPSVSSLTPQLVVVATSLE